MRRSAIWILLFGAVFLLSTSTLTLADRVHLKDGRTLEGKVVDLGDRVRVEFARGSATFNKDEIASIERVKSPAEIYKEKAAALAEDDAQGHFQLAQWCREQGLKEEARAELLRVISIDPEHAQARALLGHVKVGDQWVDTTTTDIVTVNNQAAARAEVKVDGEQAASVEAGGTGKFSTSPGKHTLEVALAEERRLSARVDLAPRTQYSLVIPEPQPEQVLRDSEKGFYLFPGEVEEFVYEGGECRYAVLADGSHLSTLDGSPAPAPRTFDARNLGESLGLDATFSRIAQLVIRRGPGLRPDLTGGARLALTRGLFVVLSKSDLDDLKEQKFKPKTLKLVSEEESRYGIIERIEKGSEFELAGDGDVTFTLGSLTLKVSRASLAVRSAERTARGEYVISPNSLVRLSRGRGRRTVLTVEEGVVKPLAGTTPAEPSRPPRPGRKPRLPRDALLWGATGYTITQPLEEGRSRTTFYSEGLVVVLEAKPF